MKILQLIDSLDTGGAEMLAVNIANSLAEKGIESHLCTTRKEGLLKNKISNDVNFLFLKRTSTLDINAIFRLKKYIKNNKINIIHAHATSSFIAFCVRFLYPEVKIIWHDHYGKSDFLDTRKTFPLSFFSRYFSKIISVNSKLNTWANKYLKTKNNCILNNFADLSSEEKSTILKGEKGKRIIHIASFRPQKDHLNLLKAFNIILEKNKNWTLHLVGNVFNDNYSESIKEYIEQYKLSKSVFMYGAKSDIKNILSQATIGVLSSKSEGLPVSLLEYGLANLPVLVTNVGDCNKVIDNKNAIVKAENYKLFSEKLEIILNNENIRNNIATSLNNKVKEEFSKESFITNLLNIYKDLC